jgi:hypothetical protein
MKTMTQPAVVTPGILILAVLSAVIVYIGLTGISIPLLSNIKVDILLIVFLGMAICAMGGINRVAATQQWAHPLSIVSYILGGLILLVPLSVFTGWKLPYIQDNSQAMIAICVMIGLKILNSVLHYWLARP